MCKRPRDALNVHVSIKYKCKYLHFSKRCKIHHLKKNQTLINEPGLYSFIMKSKMKQAVKFQEWVYEEVLVNIRKYGKYKLENKLIHAFEK